MFLFSVLLPASSAYCIIRHTSATISALLVVQCVYKFTGPVLSVKNVFWVVLGVLLCLGGCVFGGIENSYLAI